MQVKALGFFMIVMLPLWAGAAELDDFYAEGTDYTAIAPPIAVPEGEKAVVWEFFWYGCPSCYRFEPVLQQWLEHEKPDHIEFRPIPAIFSNDQWAFHARAFFTAEALGIRDQVHGAIFKAIHEQRRPLDNEPDMAALFAEYGIDKERFRTTFRSFGVENQVRRAADLTRRSGITGVPALAINGKYTVGPRQAGTYPRMVKIAEYLSAREQGAD